MTFNQTLNDTESCVLPLRNCKLRSRHCFSDPQRRGCWFSWYPRWWTTMQMTILSFAFLRTGRLLVQKILKSRRELDATWTASNLIFRKYFWKMMTGDTDSFLFIAFLSFFTFKDTSIALDSVFAKLEFTTTHANKTNSRFNKTDLRFTKTFQ